MTTITSQPQQQSHDHKVPLALGLVAAPLVACAAIVAVAWQGSNGSQDQAPPAPTVQVQPGAAEIPIGGLDGHVPPAPFIAVGGLDGHVPPSPPSLPTTSGGRVQLGE
jgi:hypothetical protein